MEILKPTDDDKEYFRSLVPDDPRVEVKPMFGNVAGFVNGNMFMGLFGPQVGVRIPGDVHEELRSLGGGDFGPAERPMKEYVALPNEWRSKPAKSAPWVERALDHIAALPPKVKKPKKR